MQEHHRIDWTRSVIDDLFGLPFLDLAFEAQRVHRRWQVPNMVQVLSVHASGASFRCGETISMHAPPEQRTALLHTLARLPAYPESLLIDAVVPEEATNRAGAPISGLKQIDDIELVRTVAIARILMPRSMIRLSADRERVCESTQALCFLAGANSIFSGDTLQYTGNARARADAELFDKLGLRPVPSTNVEQSNLLETFA